MDNYGIKRGYNNSSGLIYIYQGNTNLDSKDNNGLWLPFYSESMPMYENDENITAFLKASRNGIKQKIKGVRRLKLNKSVEQEGGTETMADFQSI